MRLDKFLKVSRVIKRRTVAKEVCEQGRVYINGKQAKPASEVRTGDIVEIHFGSGTIKFEVMAVEENPSKENAGRLYKLIE